MAVGGIRTTEAPNRYVPTSGIAENGCGRSTECMDKMRQTPRTGENDCDVGTYRQVRPTFPKRADAYDVNGGFHTGRCPPNAEKGIAVSFRAAVPFIWQLEVSGQRTHLIGTSLHPAPRKTATGSQRNAGIGCGEGRVGMMLANVTNGGE